MSDKNTNEFVTKERKTACKTAYDQRPTAETENQTSSGEKKKEELLRKSEKQEKYSSMTECDLQETYKNACTGKESVEILRRFSQDKGFKNILIRQYKEYSTLAKEMEISANKLGYELKPTSFFAKSMMCFTTAVNTFKDKSDSKLSEIYIQGINMGIIAMTKILNHIPDEEKERSFAHSLLTLLQKNLEEMKLFL